MDGNQQALWNFDDKVGAILSDLKAGFLSSMFTWDLETAYFNVRLLWMEVDAKLDTKSKAFPEFDEKGNEIKKEKRTMTEQTYAAVEMNNLEKSRSLFLESSMQKGVYYFQLEKFYMLICKLMKINGLYYREGHDSSKAALRR